MIKTMMFLKSHILVVQLSWLKKTDKIGLVGININTGNIKTGNGTNYSQGVALFAISREI